MVSIILGVFKGKDYLENALQSIFSQTFQKYEVLVIDEYGKDGVEELVKSYEVNKIKYFLKDDEGPGAVVKYGLERCSYDLVAIIEQDDYWFSDKIEKQVEVFRRKPDVALVFTDYCASNKISKDVSILKTRFKSFELKNIFDELFEGNFIATSSVMFKKHIVDQIGFPDVSKIAKGPWDRQLWLRISMQHRTELINEILTWKFISDNTLFHRSNYAYLQYLGWLDALQFFSIVRPQYIDRIKRNIGISAFNSAKWYWYQHDYRSFNKWMNVALEYKDLIKIPFVPKVEMLLPESVLEFIRILFKRFILTNKMGH